MVPACYPCPHEGQIYDDKIDPPNMVCICDARNNWVKAADTCLRADIAEEFTAADSEFAVSRANQISYGSIETQSSDGTWTLSPNTHNSGTIQHYYLDAAVGCTEFKDVQKCQLLANLCLLAMYNTNNEVCALYKELVQQSDTLAFPDYYADSGYKVNT